MAWENFTLTDKDLVGKVFGRLTIIKKDVQTRASPDYVICECSCGRRHLVRYKHLEDGSCTECQYCYEKKKDDAKKKAESDRKALWKAFLSDPTRGRFKK